MDNSNEIYQFHIELERNYEDEQFRLDSFGPWFNNEVDTNKLARAGFFYLSERDHVKCVFCEVEIGGWMRGDNPFIEHKRHSPDCPFINEDPVNNTPLPETKQLLLEELVLLRNTGDRYSLTSVRSTELKTFSDIKIAQTAKHPSYADKTERLKSFVNWPTSLKQTPEEMSDAGFFYLGVGDEVKCFYCGGCLRNFVSNDHALNEHKRHYFDRCKFIQLTYKNLKSSTYKLENRRPIKATIEQIQHLIEYMEQNEGLHNGSLLQDRVSNTKTWKDLSTILNNLDGPTKDVKGWKEVWRNYKYNQKRKTNLIDKSDTASTSSSNTISYVDASQIEILGEFMESNDGSNFSNTQTPAKIGFMNYPNIDVKISNVSHQPTLHTLVSDVMQDDENSSNFHIVDREIKQLELKIEELSLEIEKYKLELDMKIRQKEITQKQFELQTKWHEIEKNKAL